MRACRREPVERTPVWLMRQAGRYLPEYRAIRDKVGFLELCKTPRLSAEVMIATVNRLGVDAAIIFSDLLPLLEPMGLDLEFAAGEGPVIHNPVREPGDVSRVRELADIDQVGFVMDTVAATRAGLDDSIPVIGFAGAPFTLAGYCIEGGTSKAWTLTKAFMYRHEAAWHDLCGRIARAVSRYLVAQLDAGAQLVQLFDSWVGCLGPDDYRRYVLPHSRAAIAAAAERAPVIHFATGNPAPRSIVSAMRSRAARPASVKASRPKRSPATTSTPASRNARSARAASIARGRCVAKRPRYASSPVPSSSGTSREPGGLMSGKLRAPCMLKVNTRSSSAKRAALALP